MLVAVYLQYRLKSLLFRVCVWTRFLLTNFTFGRRVCGLLWFREPPLRPTESLSVLQPLATQLAKPYSISTNRATGLLMATLLWSVLASSAGKPLKALLWTLKPYSQATLLWNVDVYH
jgi:hypothetical protein